MSSLTAEHGSSGDSGTLLDKCPTGVTGIDEITGGGLPRGRATLLCGAAGSGKSLLATEFLARGASTFGENGVIFAFEESCEEIERNVRSLGWDLGSLSADGKIILEHIDVQSSDFQSTGHYDLEGLFIRLQYAIDAISAKRVVLDTLEVLFGGIKDHSLLRSELQRLFSWLKSRQVTAIITAERGERTLTRHGLEEYVADCVIVLDNRVDNGMSTRRLRVIKYRGSAHGTNEYPFLITKRGFSILPITSIELNYEVSKERVSTGVPRLDTMLGGKGYFRGASVLISGASGTGKSTLAAGFAQSTCERGERCLYFTFEEAPSQIVRNMESVGFDLDHWVNQGKLEFHAARPTLFGLEQHLLVMLDLVVSFKPETVIVDPITNLEAVGSQPEVSRMLARLIDHLKMNKVTVLFTSLVSGTASGAEHSEIGVSSLMDTWMYLRTLETNGERNRVLYVLKSRGMPHSNQVREFMLSSQGISLLDVYIGSNVVLTGSARLSQEARDQEEAAGKKLAVEHRRRQLEQKYELLKARMGNLELQMQVASAEMNRLAEQELREGAAAAKVRDLMAKHRGADPDFQHLVPSEIEVGERSDNGA